MQNPERSGNLQRGGSDVQLKVPESPVLCAAAAALPPAQCDPAMGQQPPTDMIDSCSSDTQ